MNVTERCTDWIATDSDDNAESTATRAAPEGGQSHYVTSISGGYSATKSGLLLTLKEGATTLAIWPVYDSKTITFPSPIKIKAGTAVSAVLAASGTGGTLGYVNVAGYTQ